MHFHRLPNGREVFLKVDWEKVAEDYDITNF